MPKRICVDCKIEKNLADFSRDKTHAQGRAVICKMCMRIRSRAHYSTVYLEKRKAHNRLRASASTAYLQEVKSTGCVKCGEATLVCLDLHHTDPNEKDFSLSAYRNASMERLKVEVQKCVVLCANCHRKVHAGILVI